MHFVFIPYGKRSEVELIIRDMEAQKHKLLMTKGKKKQTIWIQGQIRLLPFGIMEYVCPKEDADTVLNTLRFTQDRYQLGMLKLGFMRKMINVKKIPKFKTDNHYLWIQGSVNIIPLGVRYDGEITDPYGKYKGWKHEAI